MTIRSLKPSEHDEQAVVVRWFDLAFPQLEGLLFAIPNAGKRSRIMGARMKAEGMRAGVSDLMLPVARHGFHGLFIEMKVGKNPLTVDQAKWLERVGEQGYMAVCCRGADAAMDTIKSYLHSGYTQ